MHCIWLLLLAIIKSVVKSFKVPVVEVVAARLGNESALRRLLTRLQKISLDLTLVQEG